MREQEIILDALRQRTGSELSDIAEVAVAHGQLRLCRRSMRRRRRSPLFDPNEMHRDVLILASAAICIG
jgi:hypothetical protein